MQQVWLITGCSGGLGEAFIKSLLKRGDKAIATARQIGSIEHLAALGAATMQLDVTDSDAALDEKIKQAWALYGHIDVLVQNAGYGFFGAMEDVRCVLCTISSHISEASRTKIGATVMPISGKTSTPTSLASPTSPDPSLLTSVSKAPVSSS
jgi:NAD(P)-dependent dehydrogenase (short-subunit alcohol dehydrogenase family)